MKTFLAIVALLGLFVSATCAEEIKPTTSLDVFHAEAETHPVFEIVVRLASLPSSKVILQKVCESPPATGGFETVFEEGDMHYTCWLWKDEITKQNRFRVYYYPIGKQTEIKIFTDNSIDGFVDDAFKKDDESVGEILHLRSSPTKHPQVSDVVHLPKGVQDTETARRNVLDFWAQEYFNVVSDIRAHVFRACYVKITKEGVNDGKSSYDELHRIVYSLYHSKYGMSLLEWAYDANGNMTNRRVRHLVKEE